MKKQLLNTITNNYVSSDPEYFRIYQQWQAISKDIKFYTEQNQNIRIENDNMIKQQTKLRNAFYNVSQSIVKKKPLKLQSDQIKTRMRINQLRNKVKGHQYEIKKLHQQQKQFIIQNVQQNCMQVFLHQIDLNTDIMKYQMKLELKQNLNMVVPIDFNQDIDDFDEDDCHKVQQMKNTKRDILRKLKQQLQQVQDQIDKQLKIQSKLKQTKQKNIQIHKYYNKLIGIRGKQKKINDNLTSQINQINKKIQQIKYDLQGYNIINQQLKVKLTIRREHELKENKNLREEVQKYTDQCKQVRNKYYLMLDQVSLKTGYS